MRTFVKDRDSGTDNEKVIWEITYHIPLEEKSNE